MTLSYFLHRYLHRPYLLHSEAHGDLAKPTIVLLHGIAASSEDWEKLIPLLTPYYYCITIDLLGFAQSPKPQWASYTMEDHVASIAYTLKRLHVPRHFTLAGHSMGSLIATRFAGQHAGHVDHLLLLSPPIYPPLSSIERRGALRRTDLLIRLYKFLRTHPRMTPENFRKLSYILPVPRSITTYPETWTPFFRSLEHCIEQQTILHDIKTITIPVDIFYGNLDAVVVGTNLQSITKLKEVTIHRFRGNHTIGRVYAKTVASVLKSLQVN